MKIILRLLVLVFFFCIEAYPSEIAFLPFRMSHSTEKFSSEEGRDYASLLAIYAGAEKRLHVVSGLELRRDMAKTGMRSDGIITGEHLDLLGRTRYLDYIVTGTLYKSAKGYSAESILYSVKNGKAIINTRVSSSNLIDLAEKDAAELFVLLKNKEKDRKDIFDFVFILDVSYNMKSSWGGIRESVVDLASEYIDRRGVNTRIYVLTFSGSGRMKSFVSDNSVLEIRKWLSGVYPAGEETGANFTEAMRYSCRNIKWRGNAEKKLIIVSGIEKDHMRLAKDYPLRLSRKGVVIDTVSAGRAGKRNIASLGRLSETGRGKHYTVTYYQEIFDSEGRRINLFLERSRLFRTGIYTNKWKKGLLEYNKFDRAYARPRSYLSEISVDSEEIYPDNMADVFSGAENAVLLKKGRIQNNLLKLMSMISSGAEGIKSKSLPGRVLLSSGKISFWADIRDEKWLRFYQSAKTSGVMFYLGIRTRVKQDELYGISFEPVIFLKAGDDIPFVLKTDLSSIIKKNNYYRKNGFLDPPVWFIRLKVDEIRHLSDKVDIRGKLR